MDSSRATFVQSEKNAWGRVGFVWPNRAMMSHLENVFVKVSKVWGG